MLQVVSAPRTYFFQKSFPALPVCIYLFLDFWGTCIQISVTGQQSLYFHPLCIRFFVSHILISTFAFLENSDWRWEGSQCSFDVYFFDGEAVHASMSSKGATGDCEVLGEGAAAICKWYHRSL